MDRRRFLMDYTLGGVSGAVAKTILAPMQRIKVVMQYEKLDKKISEGEEPSYKGIIDCAVRIYEKEGILGFWTGNLINCLRYFPTQAMNLAFKDVFKKMFPKFNPKTEFTKFFFANLVSGGMAATTSLLAVYPADHLNHCLVTDTSRRFQGPVDVAKKTLAKGFHLFYTGFGISVVGILAYRGIQLNAFDKVVALNPWSKEPGDLGFWSKFVASQVAVTFGALLTYPMDTVRRRLQADSIRAISDEPTEYDGTVDCIKKIAQEEGLAGFFQFFGLNILMHVVGALTMMAYGNTKKRLGL